MSTNEHVSHLDMQVVIPLLKDYVLSFPNALILMMVRIIERIFFSFCHDTKKKPLQWRWKSE